MAANRLRFEEAIQKANDFVWAEKWQDAAEAYRQALAEFPDHDSALMGYAWALLNAEDLDEALRVYERLTNLLSKDPGPYERIGEILERKREPARAVTNYLKAAKLYEQQGLITKQITTLEAVVRLAPRTEQAWRRLVTLYQDQGQTRHAVLAALWLAHLYQDTRRDEAIRLCRELQLALPQDDPRLGQLLILLQSKRPIPQPHSTDATEEIGVAGTLEAHVLGGPSDDEERGSGTPVEIARQRALSKLAESIFADDQIQPGVAPTPQGLQKADVDLLIGKAIDAQTRGEIETAIQYYQRLLNANGSTPSRNTMHIHFNLGLLYKEKMCFDDAIAEFGASLNDPEYVLGSHFSLGECYQAKGEFKEALKHFIEAIKIVDTATIEREHMDDLIRVYEGLTQSLVNTGEPRRAQQVSEMLVDFLGQRGWEDGAVKARKRLDQLARSGAVLSLVELISMPGSEDILRSIALAQEYHRRGKTYSALEELFHALADSPDYLPLHHLLGVMLRESGQLESAIGKFNVVARTHENRGQISQALTTYQLILEISPLDTAVHRQVVDLLIQHGRIDDALAQYLQTADAYYQLAQPERAREIYSEALRLAPRGSADKAWEVRILHRMADLDVQRLDWHSAVKDHEEILRIAPDDERAHLALFRLYPRTGRPNLGIEALDKLIQHYLSQHKVAKALAILEDLTKGQPNSIPLRARVAQLQLNLGNREKALEHLDILGDLQLEAGQRDAALKTIEAILALDPPNREAYVDLYHEMTHQSRA